ncbi:DUF1778 domain-containing protein [Rhodoferax sp.]|uniref:type II toxin -antitoxin system TacA 1-like antitoxin n=1 Tax=Rhodoferax sp. TaxID=50421 RepID=UPI00351D4D06
MFGRRPKKRRTHWLDQESRVTLSQRDFATFHAAVTDALAPNPALQGAMTAAAKVKRA